jgi:hypothetical protein
MPSSDCRRNNVLATPSWLFFHSRCSCSCSASSSRACRRAWWAGRWARQQQQQQQADESCRGWGSGGSCCVASNAAEHLAAGTWTGRAVCVCRLFELTCTSYSSSCSSFRSTSGVWQLAPVQALQAVVCRMAASAAAVASACDAVQLAGRKQQLLLTIQQPSSRHARSWKTRTCSTSSCYYPAETIARSLE